MRFLQIPLIVIYCVFLACALHGQGVPSGDALELVISDKNYKPYTGSYALLIGVSNYTNGWPSLPGVQNDLVRVKETLQKHGFLVMSVLDPDKDQLDDAITEFIKNFGQAPGSRLVIWYAGHGYTSLTSYGEEIGYLVPVDAPRPHDHFGQFQAKAIEMAQFDLYSKRIQSNHALFVFDACFSGSIFTGKVLSEPITKKVLKPVRQFITSGSADEQVPDKSIFCAQFVEAMEGRADLDEDGYITGTEIGAYLQKKVIHYSYNTLHPQYGKIRNPRLDKGEILFGTSGQVSKWASGQVDRQTGEQVDRRTGEQVDRRTGEQAEGPTDKSNSSDTPSKTVIPETQIRDSGSGKGSGQLKVTSGISGDFYVGNTFYRTIIANSTVLLFNIPTGKQVVELKGNKPWKKEVFIDKSGVTLIHIE
jgi:hypothetical protein